MSSQVSFRASFGVHLTLDGYGGSPKRLGDFQLVRWWLDDMPERLVMRRLADTILIGVEKQSEKDPGGLTGFVLIAESHISIHTFPLRGFVSADIYTCQSNLKTDEIIEHFVSTFSLKVVEHNVISRGTQYPKHNIYPSADDLVVTYCFVSRPRRLGR